MDSYTAVNRLIEQPLQVVGPIQDTGRSSIRGVRTGDLHHQILCVGEQRANAYDPASAEEARVRTMQRATDLQLMPFRQAFEVWLEIHKEEISERTYHDYRGYGGKLKKFFGDMLLSQIHIGHILEFRKMRQQKAGAEVINHEITTLKQVMEMAGLWDLIAKFYKPMKKPQWTPPKVLTAEEEEKFFRVVANPIKLYHEEHPGRYHPWAVAYWAVSLTSNTSAFGAELRFLQLKHIFLDHVPPKIHIRDDKVKNEYRARVIPLNAVALKQVQRLMERAQSLGAVKPDHYLFPFRVKKGEYDVNRPASPWFIRSAFHSMREALGPEFAWLNPRNFRNQLFTKLFESGAPDQTIVEIGGHAAIKMSRYYSRIRISAKHEALEKIVPKSTGGREEAENAG